MLLVIVSREASTTFPPLGKSLDRKEMIMEIDSMNGGDTDSSKQLEIPRGDQFPIEEVPPGSALLVGDAAVFNVGGKFCATQAKCSHRQGPLSEGVLDGSTVTCPWHGAQFNVCTGAVLKGPAVESLRTYQVTVEGGIGRVETL
jgi:nitrite reductase/ring-hydroxylating ferredoxin subunit